MPLPRTTQKIRYNMVFMYIHPQRAGNHRARRGEEIRLQIASVFSLGNIPTTDLIQCQGWQQRAIREFGNLPGLEKRKTEL